MLAGHTHQQKGHPRLRVNATTAFSSAPHSDVMSTSAPSLLRITWDEQVTRDRGKARGSKQHQTVYMMHRLPLGTARYGCGYITSDFVDQCFNTACNQWRHAKCDTVAAHGIYLKL